MFFHAQNDVAHVFVQPHASFHESNEFTVGDSIVAVFIEPHHQIHRVPAGQRQPNALHGVLKIPCRDVPLAVTVDLVERTLHPPPPVPVPCQARDGVPQFVLRVVVPSPPDKHGKLRKTNVPRVGTVHHGKQIFDFRTTQSKFQFVQPRFKITQPKGTSSLRKMTKRVSQIPVHVLAPLPNHVAKTVGRLFHAPRDTRPRRGVPGPPRWSDGTQKFFVVHTAAAATATATAAAAEPFQELCRVTAGQVQP